ncbi:DUF2750 domain-containing protein [Catenovulum sp. SM1970]|uniref:DUF2750 domain-containing protein n=1 Tax=Marinifaba aquimaris TaxID=2741323 RepID=UPI001572DA39|nr:DUF2750 domain-containing protein [Marinifaba aquimaris]NTS78038.1 DUF2750 domain-containing protein [Marinifaba aquimaris]
MNQSDVVIEQFCLEVAESQHLFTIEDDNGIPTPKNDDNTLSMPFWSTQAQAETFLQTEPGYQNFKLIEVQWLTFVDKWVDGLQKEGVCAGINWQANNQTHVDDKIHDIVDRIHALMKKMIEDQILAESA